MAVIPDTRVVKVQLCENVSGLPTNSEGSIKLLADVQSFFVQQIGSRLKTQKIAIVSFMI